MARQGIKTDNHNLPAKLELRRHFLRKYHSAGEIRVFDCCQGSGLIWRTLRDEFPVTSYWGVDLKRKAGRLKLDSQRVLCQPGMHENVIDVDTYGSPWGHWNALLPNLKQPTTVFLTIGRRGIANNNPTPMNLSDGDLLALGIPPRFRSIAGTGTLSMVLRNAHEMLADIQLAKAEKFAIIACCAEACNDSLTRYIGLRLEMKAPAAEVETPKRAKRGKLLKGANHV